jgi:integrase
VGSVLGYATAHGRRYKVRWRKADHSAASRSGFTTKREAALFLASVEVDTRKGSYIDHARSRVTLERWVADWMANRSDLKPSSRARADGTIERDIVPVIGSYPLGELTRARCQEWAAALSDRLAPASVRKTVSVLSGALEAAVRDGRLASNPARGLLLPKVRRASKRYLSHQQVRDLAAAVEAIGGGIQNGKALGYGTLVRLAAYTGLRWSELAGLRVRDVDFARCRLQVSHTVVDVRGELIEGEPKSYEARSVSVPQFVLLELAVQIEGRGRDEPVFAGSRSRSWMRNRTFRRGRLDEGAATIGQPGLTPHELRHTAASLAISAGANVKAVQPMLGHASAEVTLNVCSDLFDDDLDDVANRLDRAAAPESVSDSGSWPKRWRPVISSHPDHGPHSGRAPTKIRTWASASGGRSAHPLVSGTLSETAGPTGQTRSRTCVGSREISAECCHFVATARRRAAQGDALGVRASRAAMLRCFVGNC